MKYFILIIMLIFIAACEEGGSEQKAIANTQPQIIENGQKTLYEISEGEYVIGGSAHPFNGGDILEVTGGTYKKLHWVNGDLIVEHGQISTEQEITTTQDGDIKYITYKNYIVYQPTSYEPSNCNYSMDSYRDEFEAIPSCSVVSGQSQCFDTHFIMVNQVKYHMTFDWPLDYDWSQSNLNEVCL